MTVAFEHTLTITIPAGRVAQYPNYWP